MKIKIIAISDSDKHFHSAISEYSKRLSNRVQIINIKPIKHGTRKQIISGETDLLIKYLAKKSERKILLIKEGKNISTSQIVSSSEKYPHSIFIIGGPYGVDEEKISPYIDEKRSFGLHTMPHGLAKLVLIEQLYRVQTILNGKKYHY